jgi:hypothetical protein
MRGTFPLLIGLCLITTLPVLAQSRQPRPAARMAPPAEPKPSDAEPPANTLSTAAHIDYQLYVHGLRIGRLESALNIHDGKYHIEVAFRTFGLVGMLFQGHQLSVADGRLGRQEPEPARFVGDGFWRGESRQTLIDYVGGQPVVRTLEPPNDDERETIPPALQANTIDTLSSMVLLIDQVAKTGRCDSTVRTFDGRRVVDFNARTVGQEPVEATRRSTFNGPALRCDFEGKVLAGFRRDDSAKDRAKPKHGTAWFASVLPGAPLLPVRIQFETTWFGDATMYLTGSGPGAIRDPAAE